VNYSKYPPDFITVTCLEWKRILADDAIKDIIIESLRFLVRDQRIHVYAFVIMYNHFHLIWQMKGDHERENVQRDFLKYTGQQILQYLKRRRVPIPELLVNAKDRKYQVWERNSLSISLYSFGVFMQKLNYIHNNPVVAGICTLPAEYKYSSAGFYNSCDRRWDFLTHFDG
jgi:putative transposase